MAKHAEGDCPQSESHMKRRAAAVLALGCAAVLAIAMMLQTISFSARSTTANNIVTFGSVSIGVVESMIDASGEEVAVPEAPEQVSESAPSSRIVRVHNYGDEPAYVRMKIVATATDESGVSYGADHLADYAFSDERWVERDGWFYYRDILDPGQTTGALITAVRFDAPALHDLVGNGQVLLDMSAQGVQSDNNGSSALNAEGWPEERGL